MGFLTFVGRIVLVVINIVFIIVSFALIVAGLVLRFANDWLRSRVQEVLNKIESTVQNAYGDTSFNTDNFEFGSLVGTLCYTMIALGVILLVISFLGCFGACCSFTTVMLVYSIIVIVLLAGQVVLVILVFEAPAALKSIMETRMKDTMSDYAGIKGTSATDLGWNWVQQSYGCCGAVTYDDFSKKGGKYKKNSANDNADMNGSGTGDVAAPVACCKTLPSNSAGRAKCAGNGAVPSETDSNLKNGCVEKVWKNVVEDNSLYFWVAIGSCFVFQILLIVFACLVVNSRDKTGDLV